MKKHPLILLEIVIALGLSAVLLTVLFRFIVATASFDRKIEAARSALYARQHLQMRLTSTLTSIVPRSALPLTSDTSFHTPEDEHLMVIFDNGIDPDPLFSGPILGELFIDSLANLSLTLFPLDRTPPSSYRKEILMKNVDRLRFQFLSKQSDSAPDPNAIPISSSLAWRTNWPNTRWDIPSLIRMTVVQQGASITFSFALPIADPIPTYTERGSKVGL